MAEDKALTIPAKVSSYYLYTLAVSAATICGIIAYASKSPRSDFLTTIICTLIPVVCAALFLAIHHRASFRSAAIVAVPALLFVWIAFTLAISGIYSGWEFEEKLLGTLLVLLVTGIPAVGAMFCVKKPWGTIFAWTFMVLASVCGLTAIYCIWFLDSNPELMGKIGVTSMATYGCLGTGSLLLINVRARDRRYFRYPGMLFAVCAFALDFALRWDFVKEAVEVWWPCVHVCWAAAGTLAAINVLLMTRKKGFVRVMKWIAVATAALTGAGVILLLDPIELLPRVQPRTLEWIDRLTRMALMASCGSAMLMVIARASLRLVPRLTTARVVDRITLTCPNCGVAQEMDLRGTCKGCLLQFKIELAEPHCPECRHLLINLTSDRCPECGHAIKRPAVA